MGKTKIGIIGGAGYTGGELLRILLKHPEAEIVFVHSNSQYGKPIDETHPDLIGESELVFDNSDKIDQVDLLFLCSGHGNSLKFLSDNIIPEKVKIIDLSTDFRDETNGFVYGLPELNRERIKQAKRIANPGCFATCIQLGLLPLAKEKLMPGDVHISAITGSTGAGQSLSETGHFSWRNNNVSVYKAFKHQHLIEINATLGNLMTDKAPKVHFIPYRGNFTRGIIANSYTEYNGSIDEVVNIYKDFFKVHPFVSVTEKQIDLKMVLNTNKCIIQVQVIEGNVLITSIIDNLVKGASGQAVQNMNLMQGYEETLGLNLKSIAF